MNIIRTIIDIAQLGLTIYVIKLLLDIRKESK